MDHYVLAFDIETRALPRDLELERLLQNKLYKKLAPSGNYEEGAIYSRTKEEIEHIDPCFARVAAIGVKFRNADGEEEEVVFDDEDETSLLALFSNYVRSRGNNKVLFVGFNSLDFDVPFTLARYAVLGLQPPTPAFCNQVRYKTYPHYDVMQVFGSWGKFKPSLALLAHTFDLPNPKEILGDKSTMKFMESATPEQIREYVLGDVRTTYQLYNRISQVLE
jgi:hypothetical protein